MQHEEWKVIFSELYQRQINTSFLLVTGQSCQRINVPKIAKLYVKEKHTANKRSRKT